MKAKPSELDVDFVGSQDPADQPTTEDFTAISRCIQELKQRREAEAAQPPKLYDQEKTSKEAA